MKKKKTISHKGVVAEIEEEEGMEEMRMVDQRQKTQVQPPPEKYWTANCIEAEELVNKGIKLIGVMSAFGELPKRWVFDITKSELLKKGA